MGSILARGPSFADHWSNLYAELVRRKNRSWTAFKGFSGTGVDPSEKKRTSRVRLSISGASVLTGGYWCRVRETLPNARIQTSVASQENKTKKRTWTEYLWNIWISWNIWKTSNLSSNQRSTCKISFSIYYVGRHLFKKRKISRILDRECATEIFRHYWLRLSFVTSILQMLTLETSSQKQQRFIFWAQKSFWI